MSRWKITFLNGYLDDNIYMMQLDIFIAKGQEHLVCELHKSVFGLCKHLAYGTSVLINQSRLLIYIKTRISIMSIIRHMKA